MKVKWFLEIEDYWVKKIKSSIERLKIDILKNLMKNSKSYLKKMKEMRMRLISKLDEIWEKIKIKGGEKDN